MGAVGQQDLNGIDHRAIQSSNEPSLSIQINSSSKFNIAANA